jgi:excisionase family DNA binding protein
MMLAAQRVIEKTRELIMSEQDLIERAWTFYESRRPRPTQVTITQAAEMLGLSRHTVSKMVRAGQFKLNRCGLIPIEQVDRALQPA